MMLSMAAAARPVSSQVTLFVASRTVSSVEVPVAVFFIVSATCSSVNEAHPKREKEVINPQIIDFLIVIV